MAKNPIPADQVAWGRFNELFERNRAVLRDVLEKAAVDRPGRTPVEQKIGDHYASCMDEKAIEAKGIAPLKPEMDRISRITSKKQLAAVLAHLHTINANPFFSVYSEQDFKDATQYIAFVDQGGMGLPERDYYFKTDEKSVELRNKYVEHVQKMLELLGTPAAKAATDAKAIMDIETALAKNALDVVARRTPANIYHKMSRAELQKLAPQFDWDTYFATLGFAQVANLNAAEPEFIKGVQTVINSTSLNTLKTYMNWHLLRAIAPLLPEKFVQERFNFYGKTLQGQQELQARWKRCVVYADGDLGEALGQSYVERTFGAEGKERTLKMVHNIEKAMAQDIDQIDWMSPDTKKQAHKKLSTLANKIGYPEKWRDYSTLNVVRGDAMGNSLRAARFEFARTMNKIGKPLDRKEWGMTPPTVNAYYNPLMNDINFPAGILQPPFFSKSRDEAYNYGGIGAVIGHELTHGFDDEGRQFGADGNLKDWWTEEDNKKFAERANCMVEQYGNYSVLQDVKLNGKLTLGENVADNGGLRLAYMAAMASPEVKKTEVDGFTPDQRFFLGFGQIWCNQYTPELARMRALTDPHSHPKYRVNGTASNMPEFQKAFGCKAGAPMVRQNACRVW